MVVAEVTEHRTSSHDQLHFKLRANPSAASPVADFPVISRSSDVAPGIAVDPAWLGEPAACQIDNETGPRHPLSDNPSLGRKQIQEDLGHQICDLRGQKPPISVLLLPALSCQTMQSYRCLGAFEHLVYVLCAH